MQILFIGLIVWLYSKTLLNWFGDYRSLRFCAMASVVALFVFRGIVMADNKNLRQANKAKKDEFYTQLSDIEKEMRHYKECFEGKTVFCNCDDPFESNFFKYFASNFNYLKLKKLIATCYVTSPMVCQELLYCVDKTGQLCFFPTDESIPLELDKVKRPYKIEITEVNDENGDGAIDISDVEWLLKNNKNSLSLLEGNGDFQSDECIDLLNKSDIVVTNPPFSKFRDFISTMVSHSKDFIVIANTNSLGYKEIFKLFQKDKIRTGYTNFNSGMYFFVPPDTTQYHKIIDNRKSVRVSTSCWLTTLEVKKHKETLQLYKKYHGNESEYKKYYNFDAINVGLYTDIPYDYDGVIGVPITFLDKYNPNQFEILGLGIAGLGLEAGVKPYTAEHKKYRKEVQHKGAVDGDLYMVDEYGNPEVPYSRILIRRKNNEN